MVITSKVLPVLCLALFPLVLSAAPIASELKTKHTAAQTMPGVSLETDDSYVEYSRAGRVVFRLVESVTTFKGTEQKSSKGHFLEFLSEGNVFATVSVNGMDTPNWRIVTANPLFFSCLPASGSGAKKGQFVGKAFEVCVPKFNYYEYLYVIDNKVFVDPEWDKFYDRSKNDAFKAVERGYVKQDE